MARLPVAWLLRYMPMDCLSAGNFVTRVMLYLTMLTMGVRIGVTFSETSSNHTAIVRGLYATVDVSAYRPTSVW